MSTAVAKILAAKAKADESVDFTPMDGAVCPECGTKKMPVVTSRKWKNGTRIRYHHCPNKQKCLLAIMDTSIKSVQENR